MRLIGLILFLHFGLLFTSFSQYYDSIRIELEGYMKESNRLRQYVMPTIKEFGYKSEQFDSLNREIHTSDSITLIRVKSIIEKYGWLGISQIGEEANNALYLSIQHASDEERVIYYPLLKTSAEKGESNMASMATMYDRIMIDSGKKQKYGTQSSMVEGSLKLYPIEDKGKVNKLRKKVGLPKLKELY